VACNHSIKLFTESRSDVDLDGLNHNCLTEQCLKHGSFYHLAVDCDMTVQGLMLVDGCQNRTVGSWTTNITV
jgi:hypothetical protein